VKKVEKKPSGMVVGRQKRINCVKWPKEKNLQRKYYKGGKWLIKGCRRRREGNALRLSGKEGGGKRCLKKETKRVGYSGGGGKGHRAS